MTELSIEVARAEKWERGQKKYGPVFIGHPLEQLDDELLDAMNYVEEAHRQGYVCERFASHLIDELRSICVRVRWVKNGDLLPAAMAELAARDFAV